jgi:hypothetical protein
MRLVDHRLVVRASRRPVVTPIEVRVDHHRLHHVPATVRVVARGRIVEPVPEQRLVPVDGALDRPGVRVQEQLRRIAPQPGRRLVRAVDPGTRTGSRRRHPAGSRATRTRPRRPPVACLIAGVVEEAQFHPLGDLTEEREVRPRPVVAGTQRIGTARPHLAHHQTPPSTRAHGARNRASAGPALGHGVPAVTPAVVPGTHGMLQLRGCQRAAGASSHQRTAAPTDDQHAEDPAGNSPTPTG